MKLLSRPASVTPNADEGPGNLRQRAAQIESASFVHVSLMAFEAHGLVDCRVDAGTGRNPRRLSMRCATWQLQQPVQRAVSVVDGLCP